MWAFIPARANCMGSTDESERRENRTFQARQAVEGWERNPSTAPR